MKKLILILMIASVLVLSACTNNPTGPTFQPFIGGAQAIKMETVPGMPPTEAGAILDAGQSFFGIQLRLTNAGEYDVDVDSGDEVFLELSGISPSHFGITEADLTQSIEENLPGARKLIDGSTQPGQSTVLTYEGLSYLADARGDTPITYNLNLCYDYETKSTTQVCMVGDVSGALVNSEQQTICKVNEVKSTHNSAGPVQVTEFSEVPQGGSKVSVIFKVGHLGSGQIFKLHSDNGCDYALQNTDRNKVQVTVYLPEQSDARLECAGFTSSGKEATGEVTLYEGTPRTVTCTLESLGGSQTYYQDILSVDLRYRYGETMQQSIVIKDLGVQS